MRLAERASWLGLVLAVSWYSPRLALAEPTPKARLAGSTPTPKLFISCAKECFSAYLRQELSYFDFVREPGVADFTLVVVRQPAGNGGERFTTVLSSRVPTQAPPERSFLVEPGAPADVSRRKLLQSILRLLQGALAGTPHEAAFVLAVPARTGATLGALSDPWNYWVVAPGLAAEGDGGSGYYFLELTSALTLRRITEASKLRVHGAYARKLSGFRLEDGSRIHGDVYDTSGRALYARSLGQRWAFGGVATVRSSEFENLKAHAHGGPLVELNVFPYSQNASRQLRFAYQAGAWSNWYLEENAASLQRELRPYHALSLIADLNQAWGSVQWVGQLNAFMNAPERFRASTGVVLSLRLFEGLAVSLEGQAALVRDQINLRKRVVTDAELLLWTAEQPTKHTFELKFGLTYTFGSVHNTIVNPRFGRVDLEED